MENFEQWFDIEEGKSKRIASTIFDEVDRLMEEKQSYIKNCVEAVGLYRGSTVNGFRPGEWRPNIESMSAVRINNTRVAVDSLFSRITANFPHAAIVSSGAPEEVQNQAEQMQLFLDGVIEASNLQKEINRAFLDALITGIGHIKILLEEGEVKVERLLPCSVWCDEQSCLDGHPQVVFEERFISRRQLKKIFGENAAEAIDQASCFVPNAGRNSKARDLIRVIEAWSLGTENESGRHVICTHLGTLLDEEWKLPFTPIIPVRWSYDVLGYFGQGMVELVKTLQMELDAVTCSISEHITLLGQAFITVHEASGVDEEKLLQNLPARLISYRGQVPPVINTPTAISPQVVNYAEGLEQKILEAARLSPLTAQSQKPTGLDSGVALRTFHDIETGNFTPIALCFEDAVLETAKRIIAIGMASETWKVKTIQGNRFETKTWNYKDWKENTFVIKIKPTSFLSISPAARKQDVVDMLQGGLITAEEGRDLLNFPDLEKYQQLSNAPLNYIHKKLENILATGKYEPPVDFEPLEYSIKVAGQYFMRAYTDGVPKDRYDLLNQYQMEAAEKIRSMSTPPAPPEMIAPAQGDLANPLPSVGTPLPLPLPPLEGNLGNLPPLEGEMLPVEGEVPPEEMIAPEGLQ